MLLQILAAISGFALASLIVHVLTVAYETHLNASKFKQKNGGMPFLEQYRIFGGHLSTLVLHRRSWQLIASYRRKLGDNIAFMYGPRPGVVTHDLDVIKRMIVDNNECDRIDPLGLPIDEIESDTLIMARGEQWRKLRKAAAPAFSSIKIKSPNVQAELHEVLGKFMDSIEFRLKHAERVEGRDSVIVDAEDIFHRFTMALVFTCFYKQEKLIDFYSERDFYQRIADDGLRTLTGPLMKLCVTFPIFKPLVKRLVRFHPQGIMRREIMAFITRQTRMNLEAKQQSVSATDSETVILKDGSKFRRNMIDYIIDQYHEGKLTTKEYFHSSFFIFFAANKTTADAISKLIYLLSVNQGKQVKLRESILEHGLDSEYLLWCINEAMRLFPPVLMGCTRLTHKELTTREGYRIPSGTMVVTPTYTIHRLTEYWGQDVEEFRPERWADSSHFHPMQFLPFGAGKRICPGRDFAIHNIKILMDAMMRRYKFEYVSGLNDDMLFEAPFLIFTVSDGPTNIRISRV